MKSYFHIILVTFALQAAVATRVSAADVNFQRDVAPILQTHCLRCHNERDQRGELSLQTSLSMFKGGESGEIISPGDAESSYLLDLIIPSRGMAEMPKREAPLQPEEIAVIRQWIESGAEWPDGVVLEPPVLWSLKPIQLPDVPEGIAPLQQFPIRSPIDSFVAARLTEAGLTPAGQADRHTLIRRLYLDLTGLPPLPDAVELFVNDTSATAYEQLVDGLLDSPHFGEQWGRHWLDLARYADSEGYLGDSERPHAWVYREWVINAINDDMPFDQFTIEQLAGDLLDEPTVEQKVATGFHRNTLRNTEAGVDLELYRTKEIVDRVNTTGMVWLGLTLGCAECHDHKNDPISQKEFYQLYAFFNNADEVAVNATQPWEVVEHKQKMSAWQPTWDKLLQELKDYESQDLTAEQKAEVSAVFKNYRKASHLSKIEKFYRTKDAGWKSLRARVTAHLEKRPAPLGTKARAFAERTGDRRETYIHVRGVYNRPGETVELATPRVLPPLYSRGGEPDRFDLARWLFDESNPLTARVAANRIWHQLFGLGLVSTPNDFGNQGAKPSHPLLLDWLATEYRQIGWSRKALIREIVLSSTYRMSSASNSVPGQDDAGNLLLWRQNSFRVNAETVRDLHLTASGLLDRTIGRRGIRPPLPSFVTEVGRSVKWPVSKGSDRYRRGMYIFFKRTVPYPMLMTFDAPDANISCSRRERSNTPLQALTLLNDPVFYECAQELGRKAVERFPDHPEDAISLMFFRCLGRRPARHELNTLMAAYHDLVTLKAKESDVATDNLDHSGRDTMTTVARIVMNLDEFITRD